MLIERREDYDIEFVTTYRVLAPAVTLSGEMDTFSHTFPEKSIWGQNEI